MTDIPVFTAADGIATLILHEIPARKEGYILVRAVFGSLAGLLRECADFCRGAGAERVYAGGEADFSATVSSNTTGSSLTRVIAIAHT